jgi:hypothetical protein
MQPNIGKIDLAVRIFVAIVFSSLFFTKSVNMATAQILLGLGGYLVFTSVLSYCPIYAYFKIDTRK